MLIKKYTCKRKWLWLNQWRAERSAGGQTARESRLGAFNDPVF